MKLEKKIKTEQFDPFKEVKRKTSKLRYKKPRYENEHVSKKNKQKYKRNYKKPLAKNFNKKLFKIFYKPE